MQAAPAEALALCANEVVLPAWPSASHQVACGAMPLYKRTTDVLVALVSLLLMSPVLILVALIIKLLDGGSIFYWQTRVGINGQHFWFPKFRSMRPNAEQLRALLEEQNQHREGVTFKIRNDPRITPIGRFLRKTSLDEVPQLWCVLKGDMSLVGPRPPLPEEVAKYTPSEMRRLSVVPGLTCLWQVKGRSNLSFSQQVALDIEYIETRSFWTDLKILFLTVPAVLTGRGAY